jgi:hypothetical protein
MSMDFREEDFNCFLQENWNCFVIIHNVDYLNHEKLQLCLRKLFEVYSFCNLPSRSFMWKHNICLIVDISYINEKLWLIKIENIYAS